MPRFAGADRLDGPSLQKIADAVLSKLTYPAGAPSGRIATRFLSGSETETDRAFCLSNGHVIEDALATAFPALKRHTDKGRGKLALAVIERVLGDYPGFCPMPFVESFRSLASAEP